MFREEESPEDVSKREKLGESWGINFNEEDITHLQPIFLQIKLKWIYLCRQPGANIGQILRVQEVARKHYNKSFINSKM